MLPAKKEVKEAGIRMLETRMPWVVAGRWPKERVKVGIVVVGPMLPVSRPKRRPPIEMRIQQRMYGAGRRIVIVFILSWLNRARN